MGLPSASKGTHVHAEALSLPDLLRPSRAPRSFLQARRSLPTPVPPSSRAALPLPPLPAPVLAPVVPRRPISEKAAPQRRLSAPHGRVRGPAPGRARPESGAPHRGAALHLAGGACRALPRQPARPPRRSLHARRARDLRGEPLPAGHGAGPDRATLFLPDRL